MRILDRVQLKEFNTCSWGMDGKIYSTKGKNPMMPIPPSIIAVDVTSVWSPLELLAEGQDLTNLCGIRCPINPMWMETELPEETASIGVLALEVSREMAEDASKYMPSSIGRGVDEGLLSIPEAAHLISFNFVAWSPGNSRHFWEFGQTILAVNEEGRFLMQLQIVNGGDELESDAKKQISKTMDRLTGNAMFCLAFMTCNNVRIVLPRDNPVTTGENRRFLKKHGHPAYRYHILEIRPISIKKERLDGESAQGSSMPLHICRGHRRVYKEDAPLFGKYVGTFWIPQHIKGKESHGVVDKDYRLEARV